MKEKEEKELEEMLLKTLSFYGPLTLTQILLDLNQEEVDCLVHVTMSDLNNKLKSLEHQGVIKCHKNDSGEKTWIRLFPKKRSWWNNIRFIQ
jgi:transcription initiation factor IIE alpha subunit